ncbi:MAG: 2-oxoglutarate dehydrogenase complex dihydrolipoyllysine-residue succinyltransferase [Deltaproteobacteria bacterium]|nr:2-oxoglutarate dehydrogenase complex dihydrolipoyllysine-residue succinyltransferase [Deltaproteobacteria bacterium]MBW2296053.1 2-oxoglutarate dehydrogenase complex dihydrolipoyllysine-residue succinyltransferase [Deltaproteobacteria bacterium]
MEIKIPSVGESIQEAVLAEWFKSDGERVQKDEPLLVIETDKVTLEVVAEADGVLKILIQAGETVAIGAVVGSIEVGEGEAVSKASEPEPEARPAVEAPETEPAVVAKPPAPPEKIAGEGMPLAPSVRRLVAEKNLDARKIPGTGPGGRISKGDVLLYLEQAPAGIPDKLIQPPSGETPVKNLPAEEVRKPMSPIRKRIAARLLESKQSTAMLTTFNEIDMQQAMVMRTRYKEAFQKKHGVSLGFMSIFIKACVEALKEIPEINAFIDGEDLVYHNYHHIGVAIGTERGLVVPVIRHAEKMSFAQLEKAIVDYVAKIKENRLELADLEGGTFTVSNGGVYGSLLSTPILNTPQSGILGMHKIEKRPVVIEDEIVIRPMMYVALSYDHRIVDGKGAVTFLKRVKEFIENPERIILEV